MMINKRLIGSVSESKPYIAKNIALHLVCLDTVHQMGTHLLLVSRLE